MKSKRLYLDYLRDILENLDKAQDFVVGVSKAQLQENVEKLYAVIRALEIIGEAAKHIPPSLRKQYPQVPWTKMAKLRNELIQECFGVDFEVLWKTLHQDLPPVREAIARILKDLEQTPKN